MAAHTPGTNRRTGPAPGPARLLVVGGGPRAAMLLERLAANHRTEASGPLHVDIVDPYPAGAGRIWRNDQSGLLKLNSMAMDVSMFTDDSVECDGPAVPGPSLWEWICQLRTGEHPQSLAAIRSDGAALAEELATLTADGFPTRRLQSHYLAWFLGRVSGSLGTGLGLSIHEDTVVDIVPGSSTGGHRVLLASGAVLEADAVVLAQGHTESQPDGPTTEFSAFAAHHGAPLAYVPPAYTNDADLSGLLAGADVLVSGMGLAFVDLFVLLNEGRGGRYEQREDGSLVYLPSGREPILHVGSRRGVPYHSKIRGGLQGSTSTLARFLTRDSIEDLIAVHGVLNFREHLWPLIAKDAAHSYYRELLTASAHRSSMGWDEFAAAYAPLPWYSPQREALVARAVPDPADRLDFEALDRPLAKTLFTNPAQVHDAVKRGIAKDLSLRDSGSNSETMGLFLGLLGCYMDLGRLVSLDELDSPSRQDVSGWWHGFFSFVDSGPPARRLHELLALEEAGLVHFLGPETVFGTDPEHGTFTARGPVDGHVLRAGAFVEARLPATALRDTADPLLSALLRRGVVSQEPTGTGKVLVDAQRRTVDSSGKSNPWLYAIGAGVSGWNAGAFSRPHSNAAPFRDTDALARRLLVSIPGPAAEPRHMSLTALAASIGSIHRYAG